MKVKYLLNDGKLDQDKEYNIFGICYENNGIIKYYISTSNLSDDFFIESFNSEYFDITNGYISKFWQIGVNNFGEKCLGVREIFLIKDFWWKYSENDQEILDVINIYYKIGKEELFN